MLCDRMVQKRIVCIAEKFRAEGSNFEPNAIYETTALWNNQFTLEVWRIKLIKFEEKDIKNSGSVFEEAQLKGKSTLN